MKRLLCTLTIFFSTNAVLAQTENTLQEESNNDNNEKVKVTPLPNIITRNTPIEEKPAADSHSDTARLMLNEPGYSVVSAGGVSSLPMLNGFSGDRLKVDIDGMEITSACGNQMNTPMSYIAPSQVSHIKVLAGITPVSVGGDSIGGTLQVQSPSPVFAPSSSSFLYQGGMSVNTRSINHELSLDLNTTVASENLSFFYSGSHTHAGSYHDGNGEKVLGSQFKSNNHAITLAAKGATQEITLRVGQQYIPYQGFPNQYMDMTNNRSTFANLGYEQRFTWGKLNTKLYWQRTSHSMGFFSAERKGNMPMNTNGRNAGYTLKAELPMVNNAFLRIGNEFHTFRLNDYWPPVPGSMMMGPSTYININNGQRDRLAFFSEWEKYVGDRWTILLGARDEIVKTNADPVHAYGTNKMNATDVAAANTFNNSHRARTDNNIDLTALARFQSDHHHTYEFGYARKTRSPNLYERYTWGRGTMAMRMTNWFGDGNGYVGNINLQPEVAHTLSATAHWHNTGDDWFVKLTPYYSYVENYIDTDLIGSFHPYSVPNVTRHLLQFANHDAQLYGINLSWKLPLLKEKTWGDIAFRGKAGITRGKRIHGDPLYHMMPFNILLAIEQITNKWNNTIEANVIAQKKQVDSQRVEPSTNGYTLINLRSIYQATRNISLHMGISNLFNRLYTDPLGGVYLSGLAATRSGNLQALPGYGRSFDFGIAMKF